MSPLVRRTRAPNPLMRFRLALVLVAIVIAVGVSGYMLIDHWSLLDSFYMVITTIATVGYGEVHPQGTSGRIFTSALIVVGVATMLYGFGVFAEALADNAFGQYRRERQLQRSLDGLRDHFIICGYGRMGMQIVTELEARRVPYVVIDHSDDALDRMASEGRLHIRGDASSEEMLKAAGIERARGLISAVDSDERAVYIVLAARALNPALYIVARAGRPESMRRLDLAGANRTISPYLMAGRRMAELAIRPAMVDVVDTLRNGEARVGVEEMIVGPKTGVIGKTLESAGLLSATTAKVLAIRHRDGQLHVDPTGSLRLEEGDLVIALGSEDQLYATAAALT